MHQNTKQKTITNSEPGSPTDQVRSSTEGGLRQSKMNMTELTLQDYDLNRRVEKIESDLNKRIVPSLENLNALIISRALKPGKACMTCALSG